jgi:hypothetical protein
MYNIPIVLQIMVLVVAGAHSEHGKVKGYTLGVDF